MIQGFGAGGEMKLIFARLFRSGKHLPAVHEEEEPAAGWHGGMGGREGFGPILFLLNRYRGRWISASPGQLHWWSSRWGLLSGSYFEKFRFACQGKSMNSISSLQLFSTTSGFYFWAKFNNFWPMYVCKNITINSIIQYKYYCKYTKPYNFQNIINILILCLALLHH